MSSPIPPAARAAKPTLPGPAATVMDFLRGDPVAETLLPTATRYLELLEDLRHVVPGELFSDASVGHFTNGTLVIGVSTPSIASKIRQSLPRLIESLVSRGWKVNAIQLRVQPAVSQEKSSACGVRRAPIGVPDTAVLHWQKLAHGMESSPLRDAIRALIARQQKSRNPLK